MSNLHTPVKIPSEYLSYGLMPTSVINHSMIDTSDKYVSKDVLNDTATVDSTDKGVKDDNKDNNDNDDNDNDDDDDDDADAGCTLCGEWYKYNDLYDLDSRKRGDEAEGFCRFICRDCATILVPQLNLWLDESKTTHAITTKDAT